MRCPYCKKELRHIGDVRSGHAVIEYRIDCYGEVVDEEMRDFSDVENLGSFCPHCDKEFDEKFVSKFLKMER